MWFQTETVQQGIFEQTQEEVSGPAFDPLLRQELRFHVHSNRQFEGAPEENPPDCQPYPFKEASW